MLEEFKREFDESGREKARPERDIKDTQRHLERGCKLSIGLTVEKVRREEQIEQSVI